MPYMVIVLVLLYVIIQNDESILYLFRTRLSLPMMEANDELCLFNNTAKNSILRETKYF
jgi:hypothetical protein